MKCTQKKSSLFPIEWEKYLKYLFMIFIFALFCSCSTGENSHVFYRTAVADYSVTVTGKGELQAKSANVLLTPMVWPAPTLSYLIPEGTFVKKGDVIARFTQTQVENEYINAQDELAVAKTNAQSTEAELTLQLLLYQAQQSSANASARSAQLQLARIEFEAPRTREIKRLEIQGYELEAERAGKKLTALQKIQTEERAHAQLLITQAQNKLNRAKDQLAQLTLTAPYSGLVVHGINPINDEKVLEGAVLFPRMPVAKLPDLSSMEIKLKIGETEAQKLLRGMPARIHVPSLDNLALPGTVSRIDRVAKPIHRGSKVKKVEVMVQIDSSSDLLRPGVTANAEIIVQTAAQVVAVAQECIFEKDSVKIVYKKEKNGFRPIPVATLLQDDDFVILYGDVAGGEQLALREPANRLVIWPEKLVAIAAPAAADTFKVASEKGAAGPIMPPGMMKKLSSPPQRAAPIPDGK